MRLIETISEPADGVTNEDVVGHVGDSWHGAAWVLDGATVIAERSYVPGVTSDAAWLAEQLGAAFTDLSLSNATPESVVRQALARVAGTYWSLVGDTEVPIYALPSAAGVWVRWRAGRPLDYAALGDCRALARLGSGPVGFLGPRGDSPGDRLVNAAVRGLQAIGVHSVAGIRQRMTGQLQVARARMNRPGGYWVFGVEPSAADHLERDQHDCPPGTAVLLVSDGFYRLVDTYGRHDRDSLFAAVQADGLWTVYKALRALERADADCRRYPRLKPQDDASALLLMAD